MTNDVLTAIRLLSTPGQIIEVRAITEDGVASGYFDSPEELAEKMETLDGLPTVQGVYVTLNPVNPALFSRRANRIKMRLGKKDATTADSDIVRRQWLPVDIDPVRPSGVSSTEEEHNVAIATARRVAAFLAETGFPAPVLADSGNGAHLLYSIDLPNDDTSRLLVKRCLEVLDILFSDDKATIDTANFNAARIWKLYGTMSRKGDNTADRPHRRSAIIDAPPTPVIVEREMLEQLTDMLPDTPPADDTGNQSRGQKIVLPQWLSNHGIPVRYEKPYDGGTLYILDECPFSDTHKDGAYAIQFPNGAIYAGCHHTSCGSGKQRWQELRERYEPSREKPTQPAQKTAEPPGMPPVPASADLPGREEALAILREGDPLKAMLATFLLNHIGDEIVAECLIMSFASRSVLNTNGLHVSVTGKSGKGKSDAFNKFLLQVPERFRLEGAMSNKALFYIDNLMPGTVIIFDDKTLSDDIQEILKGATSSFKKPIHYRTVNKDRKGVVCTIPERCVWWVAKVEGCGDNQIFNRMLTCWIDDTAEQDDRVLKAVLKQSADLPDYGIEGHPDVLMCRAMWEIIGQQQLHVIIPFATRIRFQAAQNRRNPEMLLDLVKSHALLWFMRRERREINGVLCVTAIREDFDAAAKLYGKLDGTNGGQTTKLTKTEADLIATIVRSKWDEFTIPMLQKVTGLSNGCLHKIVHGYDSRGANYTGLLDKCPAIAYTDRTVVADDDMTGVSTRRRTNAYTIDRDLYKQWSAGGGVWIDDDPDPDTDNTSILPQHFRNTSAHAEVFKNAAANPDGELTDINTHLDLSNTIYFCKSDLTRESGTAAASKPLCVSVPGIAEVQFSKTDPQPRIDYPESQQAGNTLLSTEKCAEGQKTKTVQMPQNSKPASQTPETTLLQKQGVAEGHYCQIHATDYKPLDIPEPHVPCHSCGKKGSWYVEKLTAERKARPKDDQAARRLCRKCYDAAVRRDRAAAPPLPGVINLSGMERHAANIGKCPVCNLSAAIYLDPASGLKLCGQCHTREVGRQCRQTGVPI